jgi:hypothetical protein
MSQIPSLPWIVTFIVFMSLSPFALLLVMTIE